MSDRLGTSEGEGRMSTIKFRRRQEAVTSRQEQGYNPTIVIKKKKRVQTWGSVSSEWKVEGAFFK